MLHGRHPSGLYRHPSADLTVRPLSANPTEPSVYSQPTPDLRQADPRFSLSPNLLPVPYEVSPPSSAASSPGGEHAARVETDDVSPLGTPTPTRQHGGFFEYRTNRESRPETVSDLASPPPIGAHGAHGAQRAGNGSPGLSDRSSVATRWDDFTQATMVRDEEAPRAPQPGLSQQAPAERRVTSNDAAYPAPTTRPTMPQRKASKTLGSIRANVVNNRLLLRLKGIHQPNAQLPPSPVDGSEKIEDDDDDDDYDDDEEEEEEEDEIKPTLPLKVGINSPSRNPSSPTTPLSQVTRGLPPRTGSTGPSGASTASQKSYDVYSTGVAVTVSRRDGNAGSGPTTGLMDFEPALVSRFSDTTCATGVTFDTPPMTPSIGNASVMSTPCRRPTGQDPPRSTITTWRNGSNARATTRKPVSGQYSPATPASVGRASTAKNLPPSPPEVESAGDRVTHLQAQLDDLSRRRANLQRIVADMSRLLEPGPYTCEMSTREGMKRTVDECQAELDDVLRRQHDVGLMLHRAYRRREKEGRIDEPTGLWVRRVTA